MMPNQQEPFDGIAVARREQLHEFYRQKDVQAVPFRICGRLRYRRPETITPFDAGGECAMCRTDIVYDRVATADNKPKVCYPCAFRLMRDGMRELSAMEGWEPTDENVSDEEMEYRMLMNIAENKRGASDPKHAFKNGIRPDSRLPGKKNDA